MNSNLPDKKLFIFGYGYTACAVVAAIKKDPKANWSITATTRDADKFKGLRDLGMRVFLLDDNRSLGDPASMMAGTTHILICTPPDDEGCPIFNMHGHDIARLDSLEWVGYLSATSVYGSRDGEWVDETGETRPISKRGSRRLQAEQQWLSLYKEHDIPVHIFRLAGIYGPARSGLDAVRAGRSRRIKKDGHMFNRIHVHDIATTLLASMARPYAGSVYNISDDMPAASWEVITYACELVGVEPQPIIPFEEADLAPITRSFYADNKKIDNKKIKSELGVVLQYPTYKEGLQQCLASESIHDQEMIDAGFSIISGAADDTGGS